VHLRKPRQIAVLALRRRAEGAGYIESLLESELVDAALSPPDRALALELAFGVVRWEATLDWLIARKTQGRQQKPLLQILLRLGLYQLFWLERIPDHAAVNETVELAREFGFGAQAGFVNAVLRGFIREKQPTRELLTGLRTSDPALGWSHPAWLVNRWTERWGAEPVSRLLSWNNSPPSTFARVNTLRVNAENLIETWRQEGVDYDFGAWDWIPENLVFVLKGHRPLAELPSFKQGWFYVQDPSTLLSVRLLEPQVQERVLDACAAPGGKTTFIAQCMLDRGIVIAEESDPDRAKLIVQNCERLGVSSVRIRPPASTPSGESYDRVLVDVPCSNTGVMRRRVDLRWRIAPEELKRLAKAQLTLLTHAAQAVRPGGVLVYSTCSLEPEENRAVVDAFLAEQPRFRLEQDRELWPFRDGVDGAYVARFKG